LDSESFEQEGKLKSIQTIGKSSELFDFTSDFTGFNSKLPDPSSLLKPQFDVLQSLDKNLPPKPSYVEKWTTFTSKKKASEIVTTLSKAFQDLRVDFDFQIKKYRVSGITYTPANEICVFKVNLYRNLETKQGKSSQQHQHQHHQQQQQQQQHDDILVEFHRQSGDSLPFTKFFRRVMDLPSVREIMPSPSTSGTVARNQVSRTLESRPLGDLSSGPLPLDLELGLSYDEETVNCLGDMIQSGDICNQQEAARLLANLSLQEEIRSEIVKMKSQNFNHHEIIKNLITSNDWQVRRNGLIFLLNLSNIRSFRPFVIKHHFESLLAILGDKPALKNRDSQRQAAQCLGLLAESHAKSFPSSLQSQLIDTLDRCQGSSDEILSQYAMDVLAALGLDAR